MKTFLLCILFCCNGAFAQSRIIDTSMGNLKLEQVAGVGDHHVLLLHERGTHAGEWKQYNLEKFAVASKTNVWTLNIPNFESYKGSAEAIPKIIDAMYELGAKKVSLVGSSMGGGLVSSATAIPTVIARLNKVVIVSACALYKPESISVSKLVIYGKRDEWCRDADAQLSKIPEPKTVIGLDTWLHGHPLLRSNEKLFYEEITKFLVTD